MAKVENWIVRQASIGSISETLPQHPDRRNDDGQRRPKLAPALRKEPPDVKLMVDLVSQRGGGRSELL
jgi:hypothetical protein